jgi:putative spermidine/putrescine transport system ATP-binding protein
MSVTPRSPHLVLDALTATYGTTTAVDGITLEIGRGEVVALLGPSGCGKTTTLRMVAGFVAPARGRVLIGGEDVTRQPAHRRNIGVVFQSYALFPHLTAIENVAFGLRMRHLARGPRRARAGAALELVGLSHLAERYPGQLSGGQQQRIALARALVIEPQVLLLDEPLSNLDAGLRSEMRGEIRALQQRLFITTLFVTHDQQEALAIADRVAVMNEGRLVEIDTPRDLCDRPAHPFTAGFLGARTVIAGATADGVFRAPGLACAGAPAAATRLVLRAARLRLDGEGGPLDAAGRIVASSYLGDAFETDLETDSGRIRALLPSDAPPPPIGTVCRIRALPGAATFIA